MFHAALAAELKADGAALDLDVAVAQRGQAVGFVVAQVALVANTDQCVVQQADHQCHYLFPVQPRARQVCLQLCAKLGQCLGKGQHAPIFVLIAQLAPLGVVAVLLAATRIAPCGLQVALRVGADPHVGVGRRDHQGGDARQRFTVAHTLALGIQIDETVTPAAPAQAGLAIVNVMQAGGQVAVRHGRQASFRSLINGQRPCERCSAQ
ncbi:hypothetical protein D3C79_733650 [compost metagenome]